MNQLQKVDGSWTDSEETVGQEIAKYYRQLFTASKTATRKDSIHEILEGIPTNITDQMNRILVKPVDEHEIKTAVFSMNPNKAPGNDGMSPLFYQTYWEIIKHGIVETDKAFFHSSQIPNCINP